MPLFALQYINLCERRISTGKLKIYTIEGQMYWFKNKCNIVKIMPKNASTPFKWCKYTFRTGCTSEYQCWVQPQLNLMGVNRIMKRFSMDLVPQDCHCLVCNAIFSAPYIVVESPHGRSIRSLPWLLLHVDAKGTIATYLSTNINIGLCIPTAFTLIRLWSSEIFEALGLVRINNSVRFGGSLNITLLRVGFPYWLARGILDNMAVCKPLQSEVRTPSLHIRWIILWLQLSLNTWLPPCLVWVTVLDHHFGAGSGPKLNCCQIDGLDYQSIRTAHFRYSSILNGEAFWFGRVVGGSPSGSIYRFISGSCISSVLIVSYQNRVFRNH